MFTSLCAHWTPVEDGPSRSFEGAITVRPVIDADAVSSHFIGAGITPDTSKDLTITSMVDKLYYFVIAEHAFQP